MTPGRQATHARALALLCALCAIVGSAHAQNEVVMPVAPAAPAAPAAPVVAPVVSGLAAPVLHAPAAKPAKRAAPAAGEAAKASPVAPALAPAPVAVVAEPPLPQAVVAPVAAPPVQAPVPALQAQPAASAPAKGAWLNRKGAQKPLTRESDMPSSGRLIGVALVLVALGAALLYFRRRNRAERPKALPQKLTVLSSVRIAPKAHAVVLMVSGRKLLLGVTDSSVRRLAFIDEEENQEEEREPAPRLRRETAARRNVVVAPRVPVPVDVSPSARSFGDVLKGAFKKREPAKGAAELLAEETRDSFTASTPATPTPAVVHMVDVEGQAKGLLARLSGPRA